jgi:hypothetical protein
MDGWLNGMMTAIDKLVKIDRRPLGKLSKFPVT